MDGGEALSSGRVAEALRQAILTGSLAPGSRIRQEEVAARFATSRIPVREALRQLESEGLVTLVPHSGAWVARLDRAECVEIYRIRERLEPMALGESVGALTPEDIAELSGLVVAIENAPDVDDFLRLDRDFHLRSYRRADMPRLMAMIERFWNTMQQYRRAYTVLIGTEGRWAVHHEHRLLMEAIQRRDRHGAEELLRLHIRRTRRELATRTDIF
ncbi:GntR family transcriptional regulator [Roseomonas sp. E05]|uniref:GntR family transcriptional regulator n=1 Tax=Roseomonas sp. E05 TaxID=3046310 RepID=UPI0024BA3327|nr:GntR family transcriptional regulator [Roseomonas sp. E05]MDJ0386943.1 GntR family transcriptional regulator [Roseomonas sp. E05]